MEEDKREIVKIKEYKMNIEITPIVIQRLVYMVRGQQVMPDSDLAKLYQVETRILN